MTDFLARRIDAAAAMTYNELAQVLESKNPKTGKLYTLADLNVFPLQKEGTSMLEDGLFADQSWVNGNRDVAMRFIAASDRGWIYCRDHVQECTNIVVKNGTALPAGHQLWQMNEINKLIWPNAKGIGIMSPAAFKQTAAIALKYKVIKKAASSEGVRRAAGESGGSVPQEPRQGHRRERQGLQADHRQAQGGRQVARTA